MTTEEVTELVKEFERLIQRVIALGMRASKQEGIIKGFAGRIEELKSR